MQIAPPQILSYRYKNERSVAFKIRQNSFSAGALPRTPLGSSRCSPRPLSRLERGHPSHTLPHPSRTYLRRSPRVSPEVQPDLLLYGYSGNPRLYPTQPVQPGVCTNLFGTSPLFRRSASHRNLQSTGRVENHDRTSAGPLYVLRRTELNYGR